MKFIRSAAAQETSDVTPFTGVWIEIADSRIDPPHGSVTPFTGVWIEIGISGGISWLVEVTPFTGVWIEITCPTV